MMPQNITTSMFMVKVHVVVYITNSHTKFVDSIIVLSTYPIVGNSMLLIHITTNLDAPGHCTAVVMMFFGIIFSSCIAKLITILCITI